MNWLNLLLYYYYYYYYFFFLLGDEAMLSCGQEMMCTQKSSTTFSMVETPRTLIEERLMKLFKSNRNNRNKFHEKNKFLEVLQKEDVDNIFEDQLT